jgi:hypothetical protein
MAEEKHLEPHKEIGLATGRRGLHPVRRAANGAPFS